MSLRFTRRLAAGACCRTAVLTLAGVLAVSGCARFHSEGQLPQDGTAPGSAKPDSAARTNEYRDRVIRAGYRLRIIVIVQDKVEIELHDERVSEGGELLLPLVRQVRLADLTVAKAGDRLTELYSKYYKAPEVYLECLSAESEKTAAISPAGYVAVTGRVRNPCLVEVPPALDIRVSEAILKAGGLTTSARDRAVRVMRRRADGTVDRRTVNLRAILTEGDLAADLVLKGGDVIYVPESLF